MQGNRKERLQDERPRHDDCESAAGSSDSMAVVGSRHRVCSVIRPDPYMHRVQMRRQESAHASPVQVLNTQPSSFSSRLLTTRSLLMQAADVKGCEKLLSVVIGAMVLGGLAVASEPSAASAETGGPLDAPRARFGPFRGRSWARIRL